jgi:hypothetical protein
MKINVITGHDLFQDSTPSLLGTSNKTTKKYRKDSWSPWKRNKE